MTAIANFIGLGTERPTPLLAALSAGIGAAVRRTAAGRYAEQRDLIVRTGFAGMI